jgi:hypothetical protein
MRDTDELVEMTNGLLEAFLKNESVLKNLAKIFKKMHEELKAQGFDEQQANMIIANFKITN